MAGRSDGAAVPTVPGAEHPVGPIQPARALAIIRSYLTSAEHRRFQAILLAAAAARLVLAPFTSWTSDTPGFILSTVSFLYLGDPYATALWYNPPLAIYLAAPLVALPTLLFGPQSLVPVVSAIAPLTVQTGVDASQVPIPAALLAWKLPLIVSDLAVGVLLYGIAQRLHRPGGLAPTVIAAGWLLNPLVIWAGAVQGEVDTLAALFVLLMVLALWDGRWSAGGFLLGLAIFTKAYPIVLVPVLVAFVLAQPSARRWGARLVRLGWTIAGLAVSSLVFLPFFGDFLSILEGRSVASAYGGVSVLALFNGASPRFGGLYGALTTDLALAGDLLVVFRALAVVAIFAGAVFVAWRVHRPERAGDAAEPNRWLLLGVLWAVVGILLAYAVPQPENVLGVLPAALLLGADRPWTWGVRSVVALSAAGALLYAALLSPFAVFYPLARALGPGAIGWVNGEVLAYVHATPLQGSLWLTAGLLGGAALLVLWVVSGVELAPEELKGRLWRRVRRDLPTPVPPSV